MLYVGKIENHEIMSSTTSLDMAKSLKWNIILQDNEYGRSDIDNNLYEIDYVPMRKDKSVEEMVYIYRYDIEVEIDVLDFKDVEKEEQHLIVDEEGNPILDEEGNLQYETIIVIVKEPIMETITEVDPITGEEYTYEKQKSHKEKAKKEIGEPIVAPINYYICYESNYTHKEINPNYEEDKNKKEAERIAKLHLTKREVFLGLYQAKQVTPEQIKAQITDPAALIEFEYATEYYRGNPLIDIIGGALGITPKQLDRFFETNDYKELLDADTTNQPNTVPDETATEDKQDK